MTSPLVVQQSFPEPRSTTNPYIVMLRDALAATPELQVQTFSWRRALLGRYDVFHAHWPEILTEGSSPAKSAAKQLLLVVLLVRLRLRRVPVVRTQHNLHVPSGLSWRQRVLLRWFDHQTSYRIGLNEETTFAPGTPSTVIPHGHYRTWFQAYPAAERRPRTFGYFGLIRRYKNVEALLGAFGAVPEEDVRLRVGGKPSSPELADTLRVLAQTDPRVHLSLEFLSDAELVDLVTGCTLVVLPYLHMHNSGGVLASLSLDTPVLVPANAANAALAAEVGPGWVLQYDGELGQEHLVEALHEVERPGRPSQPDLSRRGWDRVGRQHLEAYRSALAGVGRRYSS